jgi:glycosidase
VSGPIYTHEDWMSEVDKLKHLGMLRQKPKYITVEYKTGVYRQRFMQGIKVIYYGDEGKWTNPDYEEGGCFYEGS